MDSWRAFVAGALVYEQTTQIAPGGARVPALNHLNQAAAPDVFSNDRVEIVYRWSNPRRFSVGVEQTIAAPSQR